MPSFRYVALNPDHKELGGVIEAPDELAAREKLNGLKLSIISISALAEGTVRGPAGKTVFSFEAIDKSGKKILGTIPADDRQQAYNRLVNEYRLAVQTVQGQDVAELQTEFEKKFGKTKKDLEAEKEAASQNQQKQELLQTVSKTIERIQQFLQAYGADLKTDEREALQSYIDQLIRIKDSTNLEHIRQTCEKMLEHVKKQELFLEEGKHMKESSELKVETDEYLSELKHTGLSKEINLSQTALKWKEKPWLRPIAEFILRFTAPESPQIAALQDQLEMANRRLMSYFQLMIASKTKPLRQEAYENFKTIWKERKRLKQELSAEKSKFKQLAAAGQNGMFAEELQSFFGWVLSLYIAAYTATLPFTLKKIPWELPEKISFYDSPWLRGVTLFLFLGYSTLGLSNFWLKKYALAAYALPPLGLFIFLLLLVNVSNSV